MSKPNDYEKDAGIRLTYDTLTDRGYSHELVKEKLDEFDGDLWWEVFGPAVDKAAQMIGIEPFPETEMITALHITTDGRRLMFEFDPTDSNALEILQGKVGGWLEAAPVADKRITMYCNEEGKINGLPFNQKATAYLDPRVIDRIVGDVVLVGAPNYVGYDTTLPVEFLPIGRGDPDAEAFEFYDDPKNQEPAPGQPRRRDG